MITGKRIKRSKSLDDYTTTPFSALIPKYTFDQYVIGSSNKFAHSAAFAVADNPGRVYNPLIICGKQGMGSTHLLNAIGHRVKAQSPEKTIGYLSAERFAYLLGFYQRQNKRALFRDQFIGVDILLIDDIQFIANNREYHEEQKEIFHIILNLYDSHKQIVITSPDNHPKEMSGLDECFHSFLAAGMIVETQPPDFESRSAILRKKAGVAKIDVPDDVVNFLATYNSRNMRELEGLLYRLGAFSSLQNIPFTLDMATRDLIDIHDGKKSGEQL